MSRRPPYFRSNFHPPRNKIYAERNNSQPPFYNSNALGFKAPHFDNTKNSSHIDFQHRFPNNSSNSSSHRPSFEFPNINRITGVDTHKQPIRNSCNDIKNDTEPSQNYNSQFISRPPFNTPPLCQPYTNINRGPTLHQFPPSAIFLPPLDHLNAPNMNPQPIPTITNFSAAPHSIKNSLNHLQTNIVSTSANQHPPSLSISNSTLHSQANFPNTDAQINNFPQTNIPPNMNTNSLPVISRSMIHNPESSGHLINPTASTNFSAQLNHFPGNDNFIIMASNSSFPELGNHNNSTMLHRNNNPNLAVPPVLPDLTRMPPSTLQYVPPPTESLISVPFPNISGSLSDEKVSKLADFLNTFSIHSKKRKEKSQIIIPEFRSALANGIAITKQLQQCKLNLTNLLESDEPKWNAEMENILTLKKKLSEISTFINDPHRLKCILKKIQMIKKKREQKKKTKLNKLSEKIKKEQDRKDRSQEIDKWLDAIKEKSLKLKREAEMKKEADYILLEVRKKIHEAKRTIEKIKVFDKLRSVLQANAAKKSLYTTAEDNDNYEMKVTILKATMLRQLADYEAEEKALEVMLETEQEGQLEEEIRWKIKKVKALQHKRQKNIVECLLGNSEDPLPTDSLYLFHKFHTSANNSIESMVQVRNQWDVYIAEDGEAIPQQWVVPTPASDPAWEQCLSTAVGMAKSWTLLK